MNLGVKNPIILPQMGYPDLSSVHHSFLRMLNSLLKLLLLILIVQFFSYSRIRMTREFEYVTREYVAREFREKQGFSRSKIAKQWAETLRKCSEAQQL